MSKEKMRNFNWNGFKMILQSTQIDLLEYLGASLPELYGKDNVYIKGRYIFARGNIPVVMVSHLDTVHSSLPKDLFFDPEEQVIWSPQGCGGDDRCGVLAALYCATHWKDKRPSILFTTDEEVGLVGASYAAKDGELKKKVEDVHFVIEFDRKGKDDMVFYGCTNKEFKDYIGKFGFKEATGSCSDISRLCCESAWDRACVNLSSGYYSPHTTNEYIRVKELWDNIAKCLDILSDAENTKIFKYSQEVKRSNVTQFPKKESESTKKTTYDILHDCDEDAIRHCIASQLGVSAEDEDDPYIVAGT